MGLVEQMEDSMRDMVTVREVLILQQLQEINHVLLMSEMVDIFSVDLKVVAVEIQMKEDQKVVMVEMVDKVVLLLKREIPAQVETKEMVLVD